MDCEKLLDEALITGPGYTLSDNFADSLALKVGRKFAWEQYFKEFLIYLGVILGISIVSVAMAFIWYDANWQEWFNFIISNLPLVTGINFILIFILFTDRVLLLYFFYKSSMGTIN